MDSYFANRKKFSDGWPKLWIALDSYTYESHNKWLKIISGLTDILYDIQHATWRDYVLNGSLEQFWID